MCRWVALGKPEPSETEQQQAKKRVQKFEGTDRQVRGRIMALLRNDGSKGPVASTVPEADIVNLWEDEVQLRRCVDSLLADGLIQATESEGMVAYHLPK
ncbi:A/G-specific adenine glycosylase [Corynebacterium urogenitale]|uniref:A/G-specific adenine glycosylase n=2 Tax=Corynebacterium urogenitale TaxID=2487892 RepID=A0A5J6ZA02_9CORY|nr:A/G-specific adenine glycosylase [Corynebacterium urogenitale]